MYQPDQTSSFIAYNVMDLDGYVLYPSALVKDSKEANKGTVYVKAVHRTGVFAKIGLNCNLYGMYYNWANRRELKGKYRDCQKKHACVGCLKHVRWAMGQHMLCLVIIIKAPNCCAVTQQHY